MCPIGERRCSGSPLVPTAFAPGGDSAVVTLLLFVPEGRMSWEGALAEAPTAEGTFSEGTFAEGSSAAGLRAAGGLMAAAPAA